MATETNNEKELTERIEKLEKQVKDLQQSIISLNQLLMFKSAK